ncbi:MAG: hypothetical protein HDR35_01775 [Treponema sp.]|nr:hypothetical protein [Treponema sp.]
MKKWLLRGAACLALVASVAWFAACSNNSGGGNDSGSNTEEDGNTGTGGINKPTDGDQDKPSTPDNPGDDEDNDDDGDVGTTMGDFFKNPIDGIDLQIWTDWGGGFEMDDSTVVVTGSWWGGAYIGAGGMKYDVSELSYVKFDVEADHDGDIYVSLFQNNSNKEVFSLVAGKKQTDLIVKVNIGAPRGKSNVLFAFGSDGDSMPKDSRITFTNFTFYDESDNEIVPLIVEDEGGNGDTPVDPDAGSFAGFFKSKIDGLDLQVWQDWGGNFDMDGSTIIVTGSWWGGAFLGAGGLEYDVSKIKSAKFKCTLDVYEGKDSFGLYINPFGKDANKAEFMDLELGEENEFEVEVKESMSTSNILFQIGGVDPQPPVGTELTIKDFTFYDEDGNEVVPQLVQQQ